MKRIYLILTTISILHFGCSKNDTPATTGQIEVYVAGKDQGAVALWHGGQQLFWEGTFGWTGNAYGVTIKDTNVYVAGNLDNKAVYWKNGEETNLSDPMTETGVAKSIFFSGNDMYVAGFKIDNSTSAYQAGYWKNGSFNVLIGAPFKEAECRDIAVVNNTVHAVGYADISPVGSNGDFVGVYWKNGDSTILATQGFSLLNAIKVVGNDVYIAGRNNISGTYWKNGVRYDLGDFTEAEDIDVWNGDVYVAGYTYSSNNHTAAYWKNGEKVELETGIATGLQIVDGDVYISGYIDIDNIPTAVYWKNGIRNTIGISSSPGLWVETAGIGVMKR